MAAKIKLTVACDDFEIVRPLGEGAVEAEGLELAFVTNLPAPERHTRMVREIAFDVCEINVSTYCIARDRNLPLTAIPVFLYRKFRHSAIYVNAASAIESPRDLIGKRIGGPNMQAASNVWIRGILEEFHDVPHREITWINEKEEEISFDPPPGLRTERLAPGRSMDALLAEGEIPAVISPLVPEPFAAGDPRVRRLFADSRKEEADYFRRTRIFPIMHVLAIRQELVDRHPWIVGSLMAAFESAKQAAYKRIANTRLIPLAWFAEHRDEERRLLGADPWEYGLGETNRKNLQTAVRYTREQGLIRQNFTLDDLFV